MTCPVCDYSDPDLDSSFHSFDICARCGTEFGSDDCGKTHAQLRQEWIDKGKPFWFYDAAMGLHGGLRG